MFTFFFFSTWISHKCHFILINNQRFVVKERKREKKKCRKCVISDYIEISFIEYNEDSIDDNQSERNKCSIAAYSVKSNKRDRKRLREHKITIRTIQFSIWFSYENEIIRARFDRAITTRTRLESCMSMLMRCATRKQYTYECCSARPNIHLYI